MCSWHTTISLCHYDNPLVVGNTSFFFKKKKNYICIKQAVTWREKKVSGWVIVHLMSN
jgi:hypothetical protein